MIGQSAMQDPTQHATIGGVVGVSRAFSKPERREVEGSRVVSEVPVNSRKLVDEIPGTDLNDKVPVSTYECYGVSEDGAKGRQYNMKRS